MSADDDLHTGDSETDDHHQELARLNALHDDLVEAVQTAINPTVRADLAAELRSVRERIAELSIADGGASRPPPEPGRTVHSYEVPPVAPEQNGSGTYPEAGGAYGSTDGAYGNTDGAYGNTDGAYGNTDGAYGSTDGAYGTAAGPYGNAAGYDGAEPARHEDDRYAAGPGPNTGEFDRAPTYGYQQPGPAQAQGQGPAYGAPGYGSDPMWNRGQPGMADPRLQGSVGVPARPQQRSSFWSSRPWLPLVLAILGGLALAAIVGFGGVLGGGDDEAETVASEDVAEDPAGASSAAAVVGDVRNMLDGMGYGAVGVDELNGSVALSGSVPSDADRQAVIGAASALVGSLPFDSSGLTVAGAAPAESEPPPPGPGDPASVMQRELERILAGTPIRFDQGQVAVTERHQAILNNVVATMAAYPEQRIIVVGYTDDQGTPEANEQLSLARAQNVKDYLVSQGVTGDRLDIRAVGEAEATGVAGLANLERRVEFEVVGVAAAGAGGLRIGVVAPSASNDLAFSQSMVDAVNLLAQERGLDVSVTDSTFVESDAAAALRGYAEQGYDLVIGHGSQFGPSIQELAGQFPGIAFAWGTASDNFGLTNVYAYDAKAQEGGYVLGALAGILSGSNAIGIVGPLEVGDAALYVNGFQAGAQAERPGIRVDVDYIESFSDIGLAAQAANVHIDNGADVLSGSAQMVVGAVDVAAQRGALWFGTQSNQASLAPEIVVASQVYRWDVLLRPILDDVAAGRSAGSTSSLTLANGGLVIEYNEGYALPAEARQRADQLVADIASGAIIPPG
ncbi:MAG: BMP family ABC transporter substrate-binding protein [Actinomycetota bacterium]